MKPTTPLSPAAQFFFDHAGSSYNPATETPEQGRTRCAIQLAEAEALYLRAHQVSDVTCEWVTDPDADLSWMRPKDRKNACVEGCGIKNNEEYLASLWGITDADDDYKRVVRAELALECADQLRQIIEGV